MITNHFPFTYGAAASNCTKLNKVNRNFFIGSGLLGSPSDFYNNDNTTQTQDIGRLAEWQMRQTVNLFS